MLHQLIKQPNNIFDISILEEREREREKKFTLKNKRHFSFFLFSINIFEKHLFLH